MASSLTCLLILCFAAPAAVPDSPGHARAWAVLSVLSIWLSSVALASAKPLGASNKQNAALCRLRILGGDNGTLQHASMNCTGTTKPTVVLNAAHLGSFQRNFRGVVLAASCESKMTEDNPCLIAVCSGTIVMRYSRVARVRDIPIKGLVCVVRNSRLEVHSSRFIDNQIRPIMVGDHAHMILRASNVWNNEVGDYADGGGLWVEGDAHVTITGGSRVQNNVVDEDGGGLAVWDNASVTITGGSMVQGNMAGGDGGGMTVGGNASVVVAGGSTISNNTADGSVDERLTYGDMQASPSLVVVGCRATVPPEGAEEVCL